ncbi:MULTISPECIES: acyl-CoA carboxylase subunit epsilon [Rhodococcus]|uniref:acyl-CoA carboxylase subunit epsilon n=1 Tax=Rhodococcus sp. DMU2021 TaxID=2866997 RepID=UPI000EB3CB40|nr:acyl-CoA carboxylase subunit epsilon [Rhodococcus sp. DMU2021]MBX4171910.1 acyl-CoA carboxylase subunit epsilon [Rhodococcus sp. DMU2021]
MTATAEDKIITEFEVEEQPPAVEATAADDATEAAQESTAVAETAAAIRIVKGNPADEEIAALVAVLAAAAASAGNEVVDTRPPETWGDPTRTHRQWAPFSPYSYPNRG